MRDERSGCGRAVPWIAAVIALSCGVASGCSAPGGTRSGHAQVRIASMLIGLSTTGLEWDSVSSFANHFRGDVATALLSADPYAAAAAVLSNVAADLSTSLDAPDPAMTATIYIDGVVANRSPRTSTSQNHDTFFPTFPGGGWTGVPLDSDIRISVSVEDEDLTDFEPICVAELNTSDVMTALDAAHVVQIDVSGQCQNQLLFIGLSAIPME